MSLRITNIQIDNYISIGSAKMDFKNGIYLVKGKNTDKELNSVGLPTSTNISNGAGKTTLFSAIYQGLFNKNSKDSKASVSEVCNIYTGKQYAITVTLDKDGIEYIIVNDRDKGKISISREGEDVTPKGITNQLTYIRNIIGFDFQTFTSLTFLNADSLQNIIDLTNKDNIVYQFFDIESINNMEKSIKKRKKDLVENRTVIVSKLAVLDKQLGLLSDNVVADVDALSSALTDAQEALNRHNSSDKLSKLEEMSIKVADLRHEKDFEVKKLTTVKEEGTRLRTQLEELSKGTCPTCKQSFKGSVEELEAKLATLTTEYKLCRTTYDTISKELALSTSQEETLRVGVTTVSRELETRVSDARTRLAVAEDRIARQESLKKSFESLEAERELLSKELPRVEVDLKAHNALLELFKSGAVVNEYLRKYRVLLVKNFDELKKYTSFDIDIKIRVTKGKMTYTFLDDGKEKPFSMLSAGERTRVSLMLLLATLQTIEQLTNTTVNYLVLDELLGVLDEEGIQFLKNVLSAMRTTKSVFIITHHAEIEDSFADGIVHIIKEKNITRVES